MDKLKHVLKLIFRSSNDYQVDYIQTFVILRVVQVFLIVQIIGLIIRIIMDVTGIRTITENNILLPLSHPITLVGLGIIVLIAILKVIFSPLLVRGTFKLTHNKPRIIQQEPFRETFRQWTVVLVLFAFFLISGFNFINLERFGYESNTAVIAHRGFMDKGVENTISSIVESKKVGAEIVEIDVQQTKDGQFVVFHDESLSRLSLRSGIIHQMTLAELTDITVFDKGLYDKIPSLEQVLDVSQKLNIKLLIELKTHGYETDDMLEQLVAVIAKYDALDVHYVQSPDFLQMEELEAIEPRIHTGIVFTIAFEELPKTTVEFVSIEQSFASPAIQKQAQEAGKELFVWTVNEEEDIQHFLEQNIDGMITDHPDVALSNRLLFSEQIDFVRKLLNKINIID